MKQLLVFALLLLISPAFGQEVLSGIEGNPAIEKAYKQAHFSMNKNLLLADTLELPFFDDFSDSFVYPKSSLWVDKDVFINTNYSSNPVSVGIATLDAADYKGSMYKDAVYTRPFRADHLTSQPINLFYPNNTTIWLSFYYQPQGLGDAPEKGDSLFVEFYAPQKKEWTKVWAIAGGYNQDFKQVILPVNRQEHLQKGFQFRFANYVSLSGSSRPSKVGNVDHWNIDYVKLDKNRSINDTEIHDITFITPLQSLLKEYEAIPWNHFKLKPETKINKNIELVIRNRDNVLRYVDSLNFQFVDNWGTNQTRFLEAGARSFLKSGVEYFNKPHDYIFESDSHDSALFEIKAEMITNELDPKANNQLTYKQLFSNYYAYDDGSAEAGYGLIGEGSRNAKLAYQFTTYEQDTLVAIQMYFTRTLYDASQKYFFLTIWDQVDTVPGNVLYSKVGFRPFYTDSLNEFITFVLDTALVMTGTFYVGWRQTTPDLLNIGFDINRTHNNKVLFNITGEWQKSVLAGSLMIRPVFAASSTYKSTTDIESNTIAPTIEIFPNPTSGVFKIQIDGCGVQNVVDAILYDRMGGKVAVFQNITNNTLDVSNLPAGIYFLNITDSKTFSVSKKVVIIKD